MLRWTMKTLLLATLTCLSFSAFAQKLPLQSGDFKLDTGDKRLCSDFTLPTDAESLKYIYLGEYAYQAVNSSHDVQSDINPNCEFKEKTTREDHGDFESVITRVNEEDCKIMNASGTWSGKWRQRSHTVSTATLRREKIQITHQVDKAEPYTCTWLRHDAEI